MLCCWRPGLALPCALGLHLQGDSSLSCGRTDQGHFAHHSPIQCSEQHALHLPSGAQLHNTHTRPQPETSHLPNMASGGSSKNAVIKNADMSEDMYVAGSLQRCNSVSSLRLH